MVGPTRRVPLVVFADEETLDSAPCPDFGGHEIGTC